MASCVEKRTLFKIAPAAVNSINLQYGSIFGFVGQKKLVTKFPYWEFLHASTLLQTDVSYKLGKHALWPFTQNGINRALICLSQEINAIFPDSPSKCK